MSDRFGMPMVDVRTNKELIAEINQLTAENARLRAALIRVADDPYFDQLDAESQYEAGEALKGQQ